MHADGVVLLRGQRPAADAGRVGLHHADHAVDPAARHAGAARHAHARRVAAGHEREGAVVDVEERTLGTLEQHPLALLDGCRAGTRSCRRRAAAAAPRSRRTGVDRGRIQRRGVGLPVCEQAILEVDDVLQPGAEVGPVEIAEADRQRPPHLVAVAGADAAAGGADRPAPRQAAVEDPVFGDVPGKDDVGPVAESQLALDADAARLEAVDLLDHLGGIEHDAAGDHAGHAVAEDAAGDDRELPGLAAGHDRVARVGPARVADDDVVIFGQDVDELALGLVAPLQTDDAGAGHGPEVLTTRENGERLAEAAA